MVDQSVETQIRTTVTDDEVDVGIDYHSKLLAHWMRSASDWHRSYQLSSTHCLTHSINPTNPIDSYLQQQQQNSSEYQHHQTSASTSTSTSTSNSNITTHSAILSTPISTGNGHGQHQPVILADRSTQTIRPTGSSSPSLIATDQPDDRPQEGVHILAPVTPSPTPVRIRSEGENCHRSFTAEEVSSSRERSEESHHQTVTRGRITDSKRRRVSSSSIELVNLLEVGQVDDDQQTRSLSIASSSTAVERQKVLRDEEPERKRGRRSVRDDDLSLSAYDRLSVRERDRRFPDVKGWVSFLNRSIDENEVDVRVRSRKSRLDLRGFRVYYLLDSTIRERLNETDRTIMMRLKESGARISDDLLDPSEISHVIISEPGSDWKTFEQLVRRKFVDDRDRSAKFIRRCSADHSSEGHPGQPRIWVLDVNWVETCLKHQTLVSEHLMSIRPDQRNGSSSSSRRSASERHQHLDSQEDDQSGGSLRKNSLEEVLSVEDDDEDEIETSVVLPRGGLVLLSKQQQPAINEDRTNTDSTDRSDHRNNAQINCAAGVSNSSSRNVKRALVGLESQVKLAHLGEGDTDEETSVDLSSENNVEGPYFSSSSTTKSTKNLVDRKNGRKKKDGLKEKGYDCERSGSVRFDGPNEDICQRMEEILKLYGNNPNDLFRILSLRKSIGILRSLNRRVEDERSLLQLRGIGKRTAQKIIEIAQTGNHRRLELISEEDKVRNLFMGIYGVGKVLAVKWYRLGLRSLRDVKELKGDIRLSEPQRIGLKYYDDLQERIPRSEVEAIFKKILIVSQEIDCKLKLELMGSYRRGEETCGDIDIILTRDNSDGKDHSGILRKLHRLLKKKSIITYDLSLPSDIDSLSAKYMGLCCLMDDVGSCQERSLHNPIPRRETKQRRIDILCVPYNQIGAAYIYFTGNDLFNRSIRLKARHMGYRLTNHGLFKRKSNDEWVRSRGREEDDEFLVESRSEEEIFRVLDVKYLLPNERIV